LLAACRVSAGRGVAPQIDIRLNRRITLITAYHLDSVLQAMTTLK
jgi:hypothetical protein